MTNDKKATTTPPAPEDSSADANTKDTPASTAETKTGGRKRISEISLSGSLLGQNALKMTCAYHVQPDGFSDHFRRGRSVALEIKPEQTVADVLAAAKTAIVKTEATIDGSHEVTFDEK